MRTLPVVKAYWWKGAPNFGDALAPLLLRRFAGVKSEWRSPSRADVVSVGSVLEHLSPLYTGFILGSGKLHRSTKPKFPHATILALRGPLTARGVPGDYAIGDPGLLADELVGPQKKLWDVGILPHWKDTELVAKFTKLIRGGDPKRTIKVINPADDPLTVIRQIGACRKLVTSSLHGVIVADAFGGIPRRVEIATALDKEGGDYKFLDYSASINTPLVVGRMTEPNIRLVEDTKYSIFDAYKTLAKEFRR